MNRTLRRLFQPSRAVLERRLELALSAGKMAAWQANLATGETWWSPEMFHLHGLAEADVPPADYYTLVFEEDRERVKQLVDEAIRACADHTLQYRVRWPDGSVHWVEGSGTTLCDKKGRAQEVVGVCVNIDRRKEDETNLQFLAQASAELAALTDYESTMQRIARLAVPHFADWCAVDMLDAAGRLRRVAVAHVDPDKVKLAHQLYERFPPDPASGSGVWQVIRTLRPERTPLITDDVLRKSISNEDYLQAIRSLGLHSYIAVPVVARGKALGALSFVTSESRREFSERDLILATDLAARAAVAIQNAELVQELKRSDAAKEVFLATLAHELRNPLAPIVNSIALLQRTTAPAEALARLLSVMERQAGQLARLVDDLLDLARINSGKIELRRERVDIRETVHSVVEGLRAIVDRNQHALTLALPGELLVVDGDPVRLAQVLSNLIENAAKYTPPGGRIEVAARADANAVEVAVSDNGMGIDARLLARIFDLFTQASTPGDPQHQGLGIGLYLVKRLVQMHGGDVTAQSAGVGRGSCFVVRLPRAEAREEQPVGEAQSPSTQLRRVLVVDDNADAADTLVQLLELSGHEVRAAYSGTEALQVLQDFRPEVVLLDIGLPDISGYEVAQRVRALGGAAVRLVALTGWGQPEDKQRAQRAGFDDHWTKPVDPAWLQQI